MRARVAALVLLCALPGMINAQDVPAWAYPNNPAFQPKPDDGQIVHVPDSTAAFTTAQTRDYFFTPDWHPEDHPPMPAVVSGGRKPDVFACGYCHRAEGTGGPENASLAGLPTAYLIGQMTNFKDSLRASSVPERGPMRLMIKLAHAISNADIRDAAAYFSALVPKQVISVVETATVPVTDVAGSFLVDPKSGQREPIGDRIIEVPEDAVQFENRDSRSRFIAYVPVGSVRKGETLAASGGNNRAFRCIACHGSDLSGINNVPGLSGRSPSYIVRQLYDFKHGVRSDGGADLMKSVAAAISDEDMVNLAAYAASLPPKSGASK